MYKQTYSKWKQSRTSPDKTRNIFWLNKRLDLEWTINGLGNHLEIKPIKNGGKNQRKSKSIAVSEEKITIEEGKICSNAVFSLDTEIGAKKYAPKPLAFSLHFLFWIDKKKQMWQQILKNIAGRITEPTRISWFYHTKQ